MTSSSSYEFEIALVGASIIDPRVLDRVGHLVSAGDFTDAPLGQTFDLLCDLNASGQPAGDIALVRSRLATAGLLERIGGTAGIARITGCGLPHSAGQYAEEIRQASHRRRLAALAEDLAHRAADPSADPGDTAAWVESRLTAVRAGTAPEAVTLADAAAEAVAGIRAAKETRTLQGTPTGLTAIDRIVGGFHPGELVILAARPSIGKTALGAQIATNVAAANGPALLVSLEMSSIDIANRAIAAEAGIEIRQLRSGMVNTRELDRCAEAATSFTGLPLRLWSSRSATVAKIRAAARVHQTSEGLRLLVIDYIGLVKPTDARKPRWESITEISGALKTLALELKIPVLALCQLNREVEKEKGGPRLDHLRDAGAIEQDADVVMLLHRESRDSTAATLNVAKNRNGATGRVDLAFDPAACRFDEPSIEDHANYHNEFSEYAQ